MPWLSLVVGSIGAFETEIGSTKSELSVSGSPVAALASIERAFVLAASLEAGPEAGFAAVCAGSSSELEGTSVIASVCDPRTTLATLGCALLGSFWAEEDWES